MFLLNVISGGRKGVTLWSLKLQLVQRVLGFQVSIGFRHPTRVDPTKWVRLWPSAGVFPPEPCRRWTRPTIYVQQLQQLGENPPRSWTIAELRSRITELREERGLGPVSSRNHTPLRTLMIEMNKASKRKGDLINYVEQNLGRPCHEQHDHQPDSTCGSQEDLHVHQPQQFRPFGLWRALCNDLRATSPILGELCCLGQEDCQGRRLRLQAVSPGNLAGDQGSIPTSSQKGEADCHVWRGDGGDGPPELEQKGYPGRPLNPKNPIGNYTLPAASSAASSDASSSHEILMAMIKDLKDEIKELKETQDEARPRKKSEKEDDSMGSYSMVSQ